MHTAVQAYLALSPPRQRAVQFELCEMALRVWESAYPDGTRVTYRDSVAFSKQVLDVALPRAAYEASKLGEDRTGVRARYLEPVTALQDEDLELPERPKFAYYALHNLFRSCVLGVDQDPWLVVNQALAALGSVGTETRLAQAVAAASAA